MTISAFPTPTPSRDQSQDVFDPAVEAFLDHLPTFVSEANAVAVAMNLNSTTDTSVSSVAIGTGAKTFTVSTGKSFQPGMFLIFADSAAPTTNWMIAQVTTYTTGTGVLVVNSLQTAGSGTIASWVVSQTSFRTMGVSAGDAVQVDQAVTAWTRAATTTLGTTLLGTLSDTGTTVTAFNGVAGVRYRVRALGSGTITHSASLYVLQGTASITTATNDTFDVVMATSTTCRIENYVRSNAVPGALQGAAFTPTITNGTNVAASTASAQSTYSVSNDVMFGTVFVDIDPTAAGAFDFEFSTPIASAFTVPRQAGGVAVSLGATGVNLAIAEASTADKIKVTGFVADTDNRKWTIQFRARIV